MTNGTILPNLGQLLSSLPPKTTLTLVANGERQPATIVRLLGAGEITVVYELAVDRSYQLLDSRRYVIKMPSYQRNDPQRFQEHGAAVLRERRITGRLSSLEGQMGDRRRRHIPEVLPFHEAIVTLGDTEIKMPVLVTSFAAGENVEEWHAAQGGRLPEAAVVAIGAQLARVMELAHSNRLQCADMKLDRLFWNMRGSDSNLTVIDWNVTPEVEDETQLYAARTLDVARLVELIQFMLGGDRDAESVSVALRSLLALPAQKPRLLGQDPARWMADSLEQLSQLWQRDLKTLYNELERDIGHLDTEPSSVVPPREVQPLDPLYERLDLGQRRDTAHMYDWQSLRTRLGMLWERELQRIRYEIAAGNATSELLDSIRELKHYPQSRYPAVLLRRRLLELAQNGRIPDITQYAPLLDAWDSGNFDRFEGVPESILRRELAVLDSLDKLSQPTLAPGAEMRIAAKLQEALSDGQLDPQLAEQARQGISRIERVKTLRSQEQQRQHFGRRLRQIITDLAMQPTAVRSSSLDQLQPLVLDQTQQRLLFALGTLQRSLSGHPDPTRIAGALRAYQQIEAELLPEEQSQLKQAIAASALSCAGLPAQQQPTIESAFDALINAKPSTPARMLELIAVLDALNPLLDDARRDLLTKTHQDAREIIKDEQTVLSNSDFAAKTAAFNRLREKGIINLEGRLDISAFDPSAAQRDQDRRINELRTMLMATIEQLPQPGQSAIKLSDLRQQVNQIGESLQNKQPQAEHQHQELWANVQTYAEPVVQLVDQHHVVELREASQRLAQAVLGGATLPLNQIQTLQSQARQVARLRAASATPDEASEALIGKVRSRLQQEIDGQLARQRSENKHELASSTALALQLTQVLRALDGEQDVATLPIDDVAPLLNIASPGSRRVLIERLSPTTDPHTVAEALSRPRPKAVPLGLATIAILGFMLAIGMGWGLGQLVPSARLRSDPAADATPTDSPTQPAAASSLPLTPALSVGLDKPQMMLAAGETISVTLLVRDANAIAQAATLQWRAPKGISVEGDNKIPLNAGTGYAQLKISAAPDLPDGVQQVTVRLENSSAPPIELLLAVSKAPDIVDRATALAPKLNSLLTITTTEALNLWPAPQEEEKPVNVTAPTVQILAWPPTGEFVQIRTADPDNSKTGWVKLADLKLDQAQIKIDRYPLQITSQAPLKLAAEVGQTEGMEADGPFQLLEIVPQKDKDGIRWIRLRQPMANASALEGWAPLDQTNYEQIVTALVEQLGAK